MEDIKDLIDNSVAEEDVTTMLPNVGLNGKPLTKDTGNTQPIDDITDIEFSEAVIEYMNNPLSEYDGIVEEGVKNIANKLKERVVVSSKTAKLVVYIYMLKKKIKHAEKTDNKAKVIDLKRELIRKQKELNSIKKSSSPELQKEITKIEKKLDKVSKSESTVEIEDLKTESVEIENSINNEENIVVTESDDKKEEEKKTLPPELKRLDEIRGRIENLNDELDTAKNKFKDTGEKIYENKIKGLTYKIDKLKKELESKEKKVKKFEKDNKENVTTEAANIEDDIKPIVDKLNEKGYKVKYSSSGHHNLRKKEDKEPDGVYYGKLYSDARIMFDDKYDFPDAPKYWHWREVDNCSYLDITPINYDEKEGTPDLAFNKWKQNYMGTLKTFVDNIKSRNTEKDVKESMNTDEFSSVFIQEIFEEVGLNDLDLDDSEIFSESTHDYLLDDLDKLLS